jgi:hypothetical protein
MNCTQILRVIGQVIERLDMIGAFRLVCGEDGYEIHELANGAETQPRQSQEQREAPPSLREFRITLKEIEKLDRRGQSKRWDAEGLPNPDRLPNILRAAGTYVDLKGGRLLEITKKDENGLVVRYETSGREIHTDLLEAPDLYDLFVRVYLKRADRSRRSDIQP